MALATAPTPEELTFLDLAEKVLSETKIPMTYREIWNYAQSHGYAKLVGSHGKTPHISLSAQLGQDALRPSTRFLKTELFPIKWYLKSLPPPIISTFSSEAPAPEEQEEELTERDYHPLVALFAYDTWKVHVKTIFHEVSRRRGYLRWAHPDLVGFAFEEDWEDPVIELGTRVGSPPIVFFSFEVKRSLNFDNLGESFFEAVSNSSWAHRGYLAAAAIDEDPDFLAELERLAAAHGIGVIQLDPDDPEGSTVLIEARQRADLDWATVNKLYDANKDFAAFIDSAHRVVKSGGGVRKEDFDPVPDDSKTLAAKLAKDKRPKAANIPAGSASSPPRPRPGTPRPG